MVIRFLCLFLLGFSLFAEEDQDISQMEMTLSAEFEPLTVVESCVNVSSGHFFLTKQDFLGTTIDPLQLTRFKVWTVNRCGQTINAVHFTHTESNCTLESSCGKKVEYAQPRGFPFLKKVLSTIISSQYGTTSHKFPRCYTHRVEEPDGRFIEVVYNKKKVETLNKNGKIYHFAYQPHATTVQDPLGQKTLYQFDEHKRLQAISYSDKKGCLRHEKFTWSSLPGQEGWLKEKAITLGNQIYQIRGYLYDVRGNAIKKSVYGNLTGEADPFFKNKRDTEKTSTTYTYSQDERNLLLSKSTPDGWTISYTYLPETHLQTSILQTYQGKIQERIFYAYDENGEVTLRIEDDGSSSQQEDLTDVTYRHVTKITAEKDLSLASFGKPKEILEDGIKKILSYDSQGREIKTSVFDSNNTFCFFTLTTLKEKS